MGSLQFSKSLQKFMLQFKLRNYELFCRNTKYFDTLIAKKIRFYLIE